MKQNFLKVTLFAAIALFAGYNVNNAQMSDVMSDIALANVEALAQKEFGSGTCYGAGAGMSNVYCYGGYTICCWAHTDVFGKN